MGRPPPRAVVGPHSRRPRRRFCRSSSPTASSWSTPHGHRDPALDQPRQLEHGPPLSGAARRNASRSSISSTTTAPTSRSTRPGRPSSANASPTTLILWGQNDIFFAPEGGEAYLRDLPERRAHPARHRPLRGRGQARGDRGGDPPLPRRAGRAGAGDALAGGLMIGQTARERATRLESVNVGRRPDGPARQASSPDRHLEGTGRGAVPPTAASIWTVTTRPSPGVHGGPDKAVYAYAAEDLDWWTRQARPTGRAGDVRREPDDAGHRPGRRCDRRAFVQSGSRSSRSRQPRVPCYKLGIQMGDRRFPAAFAAAGQPVLCLRIVEEGSLQAGDPIRVLSQPTKASNNSAW